MLPVQRLMLHGRRAAIYQRTSTSSYPRFLSSKGPTQDDQEEKPVTNKQLWDNVLSKQGKAASGKSGDLLYENHRKTFFGFTSAGSLAHIAFWSWFKGYEESMLEMLPQLGEPTTFSWLTNNYGSTLGLGSSVLLAFVVAFHAHRAVARISVVSGGDKLRITTHKFFGDLSASRDVPATQVSANPNTKNYLIMKLGNDRGFYLVDVNGTFYNRPKLESMITFRTDFTEHEKMMKTKDNTIEVRTDLPRTNLSSENATKKQHPKKVNPNKKNGKGGKHPPKGKGRKQQKK